jgi:hypothetical protein
MPKEYRSQNHPLEVFMFNPRFVVLEIPKGVSCTNPSLDSFSKSAKDNGAVVVFRLASKSLLLKNVGICLSAKSFLQMFDGLLVVLCAWNPPKNVLEWHVLGILGSN